MDKDTLLHITRRIMKQRDFEAVTESDREILQAIDAEPGEAWFVHGSLPMVAAIRECRGSYEFAIALIGDDIEPVATFVAPTDTALSDEFSRLVSLSMKLYAEPYKTNQKRAA